MRHVSGPTALYLIYNKMNFNIGYLTVLVHKYTIILILKGLK